MAGGRRLARTAVVVLLLLVGGGLGLTVAVSRDAAAYAGRIYPGVSIASVPVGGLTLEAARAAVRPAADRALAATLVLHLADRDATFTYAEFGFRAYPEESVAAAYALGRSGPWWRRARTRLGLVRRGTDVPLRVAQDEAALRSLLSGLAAELDATPQDAQVEVRDGAVVLTRPSRPGQTLDVEATVTRVTAAMDAGALDAAATVAVVEPEFTTAEAREIRALLATFTTKMASNPNRTHNIALASGFIRGMILPPDAMFSYNKTVGPRTLQRGFREAPVLVNDELVPGDGGGVCQVSSTLFNVALLADFRILSRSNHSRPVAYLPLGRDATVAYGSLDLIFKNTTGAHVLLWTSVRGNRLTIAAYGAPAEGKQVVIEVTDREEIPPPKGTVTKNDPEIPAGTVVTREALPGFRAKTYRVVTVNGEAVRRELITSSYYRPVPRTIKVGTKTLDASGPRR